MKRRLALLAGAAMLSTIAVLAPASPASATADPDVCVGTGNAILGLGLGYPVIHPTPNLTTFAFGFTAGTCGPDKPGGLSATGTVHGWCGHSTGTGVTNNGVNFHFISAGGTLLIYGHLLGVVNATPDPTTGSCLNKAANQFLITGVAVLHPVLVLPLPITCATTGC